MIKLRYPVDYITITTEYKSGHSAIDLGWNSKHGGANQNVYSAYDGLVVNLVNGKDRDTSNKTNAGNLIKINHFNNIETRYIHLLKDSILVKVGDNVKKGQVIAKMGNTGYSFGNHLHFDVYLNGKKVNPMLYTYIDDNQVVSDLSLCKNKLLYFKDVKEELQKFNLTRLLKNGSRGNDVKKLQKALGGLTVDGIFGAKTKAKVIAYQKSKKLYQDGIVGQKTANALGWLYFNK